MTWKEEKALAEKLGEAKKEMRSIVDGAEKESRSLNADEQEKFDKARGDASDLSKRIATQRDVNAVEDYKVEDLPGFVGLNEKETRQYSVLKAIRQASNGQQVDGFEKEISDEIAKRTDKDAKGFYLPYDLGVDTRALNLTTGTGAVGTELQSTFIELLRNKMVVNSLGATVMTGMSGKFALPRRSGGATASWVTDGNAATASNSTADQVAFTPNVLNAVTDLTRSFITQTSVDAEQFAREDLAAVIALEIDRAAINGSGTGAEPEGILNVSGVTTVSGGTNGLAPTWANIVKMETTVANANGDIGSLAYLTTPNARGKFKSVEKASGTARFLMADDGTVNGYKTGISAQVPSNLTKGTGSALSAAIFGNFNDLVVSLWGGLDILVNPYIVGGGTVRLDAIQEADIKLRHDASFAIMVDLITV